MEGQTFVEAEIWTVAQTDQGNVVLVRPKGSDLAVPIVIGQLETQAILIGLGGIEVPRPLTHDLVLSLIATLKAELLRIEIHDIRDETFYARMVLRLEGHEVLVDSRPSDAIGVAVRARCPVFIAESIVEEAGISVNLVSASGLQAEETAAPAEPAGGAARSSGEGELERLRSELERAVADEDYERAAALRDAIRELEE